MSDPLLSMEHVTVQFGRFVAVDDLSLELRAGELLGMIGPNGAGKTTTLRAAAGLQPIAAGSVRVFGHDAFASPTEVGRHLGFTPDTPAVHENLRVEEFLDFIGRCYGQTPSTRAERIDHWLEMLWLTAKRRSRIKELSRGMRQRLAVARALMPDPHVLLLDEPAAGLDPAGRRQFRELLVSLREQGKALIVSSHILADFAEYCTHILIMEHGRVLRHGGLEAITGEETHEQCRYRVVLAHPVGDLAARLASVPDLELLEPGERAFEALWAREPEDAARLLKLLIDAGLPVAQFAPLRADLEEAYLRSGVAQVD